MRDNEKKSCHFVGGKGCEVYEDRPWACRMYPLGMASPREGDKDLPEGFYFLLKESVCKGFNEDRKLTVGEWVKDQGITEYNEMGELFKELTLHPHLQKGNDLTPQKIEMFFLVCYNIDKFRDFVFGTSFLEKFDVPPETVETIKEDDVELLKFGYLWLRFALFGEKTINVKSDILADKEQELKIGLPGVPADRIPPISPF